MTLAWLPYKHLLACLRLNTQRERAPPRSSPPPASPGTCARTPVDARAWLDRRGLLARAPRRTPAPSSNRPRLRAHPTRAREVIFTCPRSSRTLHNTTRRAHDACVRPLVVQPLSPYCRTRYYKHACSECMPIIPIVIPNSYSLWVSLESPHYGGL